MALEIDSVRPGNTYEAFKIVKFAFVVLLFGFHVLGHLDEAVLSSQNCKQEVNCSRCGEGVGWGVSYGGYIC